MLEIDVFRNKFTKHSFRIGNSRSDCSVKGFIFLLCHLNTVEDKL